MTDVFDILQGPLFFLGETPVTVATLVYFALLLVLVAVATRWARRLLRKQLQVWTNLESGLVESLARIVGYVVLFIGLLMVVQMLGVDLTSLAVLAGALGLGIGFGLQNIVNNFVSGLIILAERPIQVNDRVVVGGTEGNVTRIGARSTMIRTNDNIIIIVPNAEFISERVTNLSHGDAKLRIRVPFGVSYGSDVRQVEQLALEAARSVTGTLRDPGPAVRFLEFGDSALAFELRAWTVLRADRPGLFKSDLYFALLEAFTDHGITIPFPQRDLHMKTAVQLENGRSADSMTAADDRSNQ